MSYQWEDLRAATQERGVDLLGCTSPAPFPANEFHQPFDPGTEHPWVRSLVTSGIYIYGKGALRRQEQGTPRGWLGPNTRAYDTSYKYLEASMLAVLTERGHRAEVSHYIPFKAAAVRAGMVQYGKNGVIHAPKYGSFIKLSVVMTDADLPKQDGPYEISDCGDCVACIKVCPSNALDIPYKVDDEACSRGSTWVRGKIAAPRDKRSMLKTNLYRCGLCQQGCPFNQQLEPRESFPFELEGEEDWPELTKILLGSEEELLRLMGPTVMKKSRLEWLRRNAAVACGNAGDAAAVPPLIETLASSDAATRSAAAWALGRLGGDEASAALEKALATEKEESVREEIEEAKRTLSAS